MHVCMHACVYCMLLDKDTSQTSYLKKALPGNPSGTRKDRSTPTSFEFKTLDFFKL